MLVPNLLNELINLEFLYIDGNNLDELLSTSINPLVSLKKLVASNNKISLIDWDNFTTVSLISFDLSNNELEKISLCTDATSNTTQCPNFYGPHGPLILLIYLDLSFNKLVSITKYDFYLFSLLEHLNLNNNKIDSIEPLSFSNNVNLKQLDLSYNNLIAFDSSSFTPIDSNYKPVLEKLILSHNKIEEISDDTFIIFDNLKFLDLNSNLLYDLGLAFNGLSSLEYLYLTSNLITSVNENTFVGLNSIVVLNCEFNQIQKFSAIALDILLESETMEQLCLFSNPGLLNDLSLFNDYSTCSRDKCIVHMFESCLTHKFN